MKKWRDRLLFKYAIQEEFFAAADKLNIPKTSEGICKRCGQNMDEPGLEFGVWSVAQQQKTIAKEREACANVAETYSPPGDSSYRSLQKTICESIAYRIRSQ
jgi:hypothetical protein